MKIRYSKKHLRSDLLIGSLYLMFGIYGFFFDSNVFIKYGFTLAGILFLSSFYYKQKFQYLQIKDSILTCYVLPGRNKNINLTELTRIKKFADEITFLTPYEKLKISTNLIAKEDLPDFKNALASLNLEPEKNPFSESVEPT